MEGNIEALPCSENKEFVMTGDCMECVYFNFCSKLKEEQNSNGQCSPYTG